MFRITRYFFFVVLLLFTVRSAGAGELARVQLSLGAFDIGDNKEAFFETGLEAALAPIPLRLGRLTIPLRPMAGLSLSEEKGRWVYAGARSELSWQGGWLVIPGFAVTYYERGRGARLGGELQFRSSLELARLFGERFRVGLQLYHLSNGGIEDKNPGSESLVLTFSAPLEP